MDIEDFKKKITHERLDISEDYGRIFVFIDFSNVNKWFAKDRQDWNNRPLAEDKHLGIDIDKLKDFTNIIGRKIRLYYGKDPMNDGSRKFTDALRIIFNGRNVITWFQLSNATALELINCLKTS